MNVYALTKVDVRWLGTMPATAGGGVTAWGPEDNAHMLPEIIKQHTGREYLGTQPGIEKEIPISETEVNQILKEARDWIKKFESEGAVIDPKIYTEPCRDRIKQIKEWLKR